MPSVFTRLFGRTTGNIMIADSDSGTELLTRDQKSIMMFANEYPSSFIDTVTETGEAVAVFIPGDGHAMFPPPSIAFDEGGLYLNDGEPLLDQPRGQLLFPESLIGELENLTFYALRDLEVKHVPALATPKPRTVNVDPEAMIGKSAAEQVHLLELNDRCAVGILGSQLRVIWQPDQSKPPKFLTVRDAREREATRVVYVKGEGGTTQKKIMFNEWKEWPARREYDEIAFLPGCDKPSVYNLFSGWSVRPAPGDWSLLRDHIRLTICGGNHEQFCWFMTWLAHIFQFPGSKPSVAVVIRGKKGTGKSIVFDFIQRLMPNYFFKAADGKRALGNFNAQYETTLLLLLEEAFWAGDQAKEAVLKDLISSPTIPIERKGVDSYMARNFLRVAMISNDRWVVPASDDERRYAIFDCGDGHRGETAYFKAMIEQMNNGGLEAMLYDLLTLQPEAGWDCLNSAPVTSGLKEQVVESLRGVDAFMYELVGAGIYECDGVTDDGIFLSEEYGTSVSMKDLRAAVRDYLADHYPGQKAAPYDRIARAVQEWFGAEVITRRAQQNDVRWVEFPSLTECREYVRRTKGLDIKAPVRLPEAIVSARSSHLKAVSTRR
jgi:hypothetical protein